VAHCHSLLLWFGKCVRRYNRRRLQRWFSVSNEDVVTGATLFDKRHVVSNYSCHNPVVGNAISDAGLWHILIVVPTRQLTLIAGFD
jgi:hypothetical protein